MEHGAARAADVVIRQVDPGDGAALPGCLAVLRRGFRTVLDDLGLTEAEVPTNAAFMTIDRLRAIVAAGTRLYAACADPAAGGAAHGDPAAAGVAGRGPVGCVCLRPPGADGVSRLEHLAVLPEHRHHGYGRALLAYAAAEARGLGARAVSIGVIDENVVLTRWYRALGFTETGKRRFDHLPFTVCFMRLVL